MLFYIVLAVASLVAAIVILWLIRSVYDASHTWSDHVVPRMRRNAKRRADRLSHLNPGLKKTPGDEKVPWGWPGNSHKDDDALIHWPHRHTGAHQSGYIGKKTKSGKPWGW